MKKNIGIKQEKLNEMLVKVILGCAFAMVFLFCDLLGSNIYFTRKEPTMTQEDRIQELEAKVETEISMVNETLQEYNSALEKTIRLITEFNNRIKKH